MQYRQIVRRDKLIYFHVQQVYDVQNNVVQSSFLFSLQQIEILGRRKRYKILNGRTIHMKKKAKYIEKS